jgi:uncharacterized protein YkwD
MKTKHLRLLIAIPILAAIATSCFGLEYAQSIQMVNQERESRGIHPVLNHPTLQAKAQGWAQTLANNGYLAHSNLAQGAGGGWRALGENVAMAGSVQEAHSRLMGSSAHRANILSGRYSHIGVGVAYGHGKYFIVQVFGG